MNTKILMMITALFLGLIGVTLAFMPQEVAVFLNMGSDQYTELATQLLGALYLGFAMLNWMAKDNLMGGIYGKPVAMGNLMHFVVGAFALLKMLSNITMHWEYMVAFTVLYIIFALCFIFLFVNHPKEKTEN